MYFEKANTNCGYLGIRCCCTSSWGRAWGQGSEECQGEDRRTWKCWKCHWWHQRQLRSCCKRNKKKDIFEQECVYVFKLLVLKLKAMKTNLRNIIDRILRSNVLYEICNIFRHLAKLHSWNYQILSHFISTNKTILQYYLQCIPWTTDVANSELFFTFVFAKLCGWLVFAERTLPCQNKSIFPDFAFFRCRLRVLQEGQPGEPGIWEG